MEPVSESERKELLDRFARAVRSGQDSDADWFDEDDLLDIFDFAGDAGNDYLRMEALLWGARNFPDSEELRQRRAVLYGDVLTGDNLEAFADDKSQGSSLLETLVALRSRDLNHKETAQTIGKILKKHADLGDEEIIQLVNLAEEKGAMDCLYKNIKTLASKTDNQSVVYYELGAAALDGQNYEMALPILEHLVEIAPYTAEHWQMIAEAHDGLGEYTEAAEALEMALAIDPEHLPSLRLKVALTPEFDTDEAFIEASSIVKAHTDDQELVENYVDAITIISAKHPIIDSPDVVNFIIESCRQFPDSFQLMNVAVEFVPEQAKPLVSQFWDTHGDMSPYNSNWRDWILTLEKADRFQSAMMMFDVYRQKLNDDKLLFDLWFTDAQMAFAEQNWDRALFDVAKFSQLVDSDNAVAVMIAAVSLAKQGKCSEAEAVIDGYLERAPQSRVIKFKNDACMATLAEAQARQTMIELANLLNRPEADKLIANYNPLGLWEAKA